jgi:hypothetical protein
MDLKNIHENLKGKINDTVDKVKDQYADATDSLKNSFSKLSDIGDIAKEKMVEFSDSLIALSPIIEETGYRTEEIIIGISIPPKIIFHFVKVSDISPERIGEILEEHKDKSMLKVIVKTLLTADKFQKKLSLGSFKLNEIEIEVGVPPAVDVKLVNSK